MNNEIINKIDWYKLDGFNKFISEKISRKIPSEWDLSLEEISGYVNDAFISIIRSYKPGNLSLPSYCFRYAKQVALNKIYADYDFSHTRRADFDVCEIGSQTSVRKNLILRDLIETIYKNISDEKDKIILDEIYNGKSY